MTDGSALGADDDRRTFLLKLAKTAVYSAPVIRTLAAPTHSAAQGLSPKMMMMNMMMMGMMGMMMGMMMMGMGMDVVTPFRTRLPRAPWRPGDEQ